MQSKVAPFAATPDSTYGRPQPGQASLATSDSLDGLALSEEADLRLVIEEDEASGACVYKTVNRRTGEVVQQFRREQLLRLGDEPDYHAGGVIRTKA